MHIPPRPKIAITVGDCTGLGPEIIVKAIASGLLDSHCNPLVLGRPAILEQATLRAVLTAARLSIT